MKFSKNIVAISIVFTAILATSNQTSEAQQKAVIGFRLMPTVSSIHMRNSSGGEVNGTAVMGFGIGGLLGLNFSEHIAIQGEIIYSSISQKYKDLNTEHRINLRYVNIPLFLSLNTGRYKPVNFNVVAGPQLGISAGSKVYTTGTDSAHAVLALRKGDLGFAYGAGLDFGINHKKTARIGIGFRGVFGLFDVSNTSNNNDTNSYYIVDRTKIETYSIYAGLSLLF